MRKKGQFMEIDILFALFILIAGVLLLKSSYINVNDAPQVDHYAKDVSSYLMTRTVGSLDPAQIAQLEADLADDQDDFTFDLNNTIARQAAMLYVENEHGADQGEYAARLIRMALEGVLPQGYHYDINLMNTNPSESSGVNLYSVVEDLTPKQVNPSKTRSLISGIKVGEDLEGFTGTLFLSTQKNKRSAYAYFGGFVGQGNISTKTTLPAYSNILNFSIEGDFKDNFSLYVNDHYCDDIEVLESNNFSEITTQDISSCSDQLQEGENIFRINFTGDLLQNQYVGGGFVKVTYHSEEVYSPPPQTKRYYFPRIDGLFNLYDGIYIPGQLTEMEIYLDYQADHDDSLNESIFLSIGNYTVWKDNATSEKLLITIDTINLTDQGVKFEEFSNTTVPIRMGYENITTTTIVREPVSAILTTDLSGSMSWPMNNDLSHDIHIYVDNCSSPNISFENTSRLSVAKCANKLFTDVILNNSENQLGLISYGTYTNMEDNVSLTNDNETLINMINSYTAGGSTCTCCGIISGMEMLMEEGSRTVFIEQGSEWLYYNETANPITGTINNDPRAQLYLSFEDTVEDQSPQGRSVQELGGGVSDYTPWKAGQAGIFDGGYLNTGGWNVAGDEITLSAWMRMTANHNRGSRLISKASYRNDNDHIWMLGEYLFRWRNRQQTGGAETSVMGPLGSLDLNTDYHVATVYDGELWKLYVNGELIHQQPESGALTEDSSVDVFVGANHNGGYGNFTGLIDEVRVYDVALSDQDIWDLYNNVSLDHPVGVYKWTDNDYDDSVWQKVTAPLGQTNGLGESLTTYVVPPNLYFFDMWTHANEADYPYLGYRYMNSSANTYGWDRAIDGWDEASGKFNHTGEPYNFEWNGYMRILFDELPLQEDDFFVSDMENKSGSYAVNVEVPVSVLNNILNNGWKAMFYTRLIPRMQFYSEQIDATLNWGANAGMGDIIWMKARWTNPLGQKSYFGRNLDSSYLVNDSTNELLIYADGYSYAYPHDPSNSYDINRWSNMVYVEYDVTDHINQSGNHYLELGGAMARVTPNITAELVYDDTLFYATDPNSPEKLFLRKKFIIPDVDDFDYFYINFIDPNAVALYINGKKFYESDRTSLPPDTNDFNVKYYNISKTYLRNGENVLSVELKRSRKGTRFDAELIGGVRPVNRSAMLVMSDGSPNEITCPVAYEERPSMNQYAEMAISAACATNALLGTNIYSVSFVQGTSISMEAIAECDPEHDASNSHYYEGDDWDTLSQVYEDIAQSIVNSARYEEQVISISPDFNLSSTLSDDSYIEYTYQGEPYPSLAGSIIINGETEPFTDNCTPNNIFFSPAVTPLDGFVASYSGSHWTDQLLVNGKTVYNLSKYDPNYERLGDPFMVGIPYGRLQEGNNTISLRTGNNLLDPTSCSQKSKFAYTVAINSTINLDEVKEESVGCVWNVDFIDHNETIPIPSTYEGTQMCYYNANPPDITISSFAYYESSPGTYRDEWDINEDVWAHLGKKLFESLDVDPVGGDGVVDINIVASDINVSSIQQSGIPYLWGPSIMEVVVWR